MLIQIIIILIIALIILRLIFKFRKQEISFPSFFGWLIFWLIAMGIVLYPETTSFLARFLGVGRGADVVVYISLILIFYFIFYITIKLRRTEQDITKLVRKISFSEKDKSRDSTSLYGEQSRAITRGGSTHSTSSPQFHSKQAGQVNSPQGGFINLSFIWELIKLIIIALLVVLPIRYFVFQPFYVSGASMEPNFYDHQYLIIDELSYRFRQPVRGEAIIFKNPKNKRDDFIKRIIALSEERIVISHGEITIFNDRFPQGLKLEESDYLPAGIRTLGEIDIRLDPNEYFVLGDNRNNSLDSRTFGPVPRDLIIGRSYFRGWPLSEFGHIPTPLYNL